MAGGIGMNKLKFHETSYDERTQIKSSMGLRKNDRNRQGPQIYFQPMNSEYDNKSLDPIPTRDRRLHSRQ